MIRVRKSHIALPRQPKALEICAIVFSRRRGGITSNLQRFVGLSTASFCRNSTQYNLYIANATDNMSHSLFSHATSSQSSVLFGAGGQESRDCESLGGRIRSQGNKNAPPTASHKGGGGGMGEWVGGGMGRWVGLQKLITVLGRFDTYKGGV